MDTYRLLAWTFWFIERAKLGFRKDKKMPITSTTAEKRVREEVQYGWRVRFDDQSKAHSGIAIGKIKRDTRTLGSSEMGIQVCSTIEIGLLADWRLGGFAWRTCGTQ